MVERDPIRDIARRTERYWYQDGIWEIGFGLINLILGAFYWIVSAGNWEGPMALALVVLQAGVIITIFLVASRVVKWLKEHITYPRTGYVAYRRPSTGRRIRRAVLAGLVAAGSAALVGIVSAIQMAPNQLPLVAGGVIAAALIFLGYRFDLLRMYLLAALTLLTGFAVSAARLSEMRTGALFFGGFGLVMMISGLLVMTRYLRSTRPAPPGMDYEAPAFPEQADEPRGDR